MSEGKREIFEEVNFCDIVVGDTFIFNGSEYLKSEDWRAVCLVGNEELIDFDEAELVKVYT